MFSEEEFNENYDSKEDSKITSNQNNNDNRNFDQKNENNIINNDESNKLNKELSKGTDKEKTLNNDDPFKNMTEKKITNKNLRSTYGLHSRSIEKLQKLENINDDAEGRKSISDDEEEKISTKKNNNENEKTKNKDVISDSLRTVFTNRVKNNIEDDDTQSCYSTSLNTEYELNYYKNPDNIRNAYFSQLIMKRVWAPAVKPKTHNSLIIFDWDDTLLPTSFLSPGGVFNENIKLDDKDISKIKKLEECALKLLNIAVSKGDVFIITNSGVGWVEFSAKKFYPSILDVLKKVKIISARGEYEDKFPGDSRRWKIMTFLNLQKKLNLELITNIVCLGDSLFEMEAGRILASKFNKAFIKTIKFREKPRPEELYKQLMLVIVQFNTIYSSVKNLTVRVEKKKKKD